MGVDLRSVAAYARTPQTDASLVHHAPLARTPLHLPLPVHICDYRPGATDVPRDPMLRLFTAEELITHHDIG